MKSILLNTNELTRLLAKCPSKVWLTIHDDDGKIILSDDENKEIVTLEGSVIEC
jgi:sulfur transfer protein SufE